jgi:hypothetical protein
MRPSVRGRTCFGRPRHDFELVNRSGTVPVGRSEAVGAGIATTNDDDVLAASVDR